MRRSWTFRDERRAPVALVVALATVGAVAGCTMCPDPYDYAGPVPNGSAPQNDFRARSRGVLPIGGTARPWPQIVSHEVPRPGPGGVPTLAEVSGEDAVVGDPSPLASVLLQPETVPEDVADVAAQGPNGRATSPAGSDDDVVAMLLPARDVPPQTTVPARETPGWKPRR